MYVKLSTEGKWEGNEKKTLKCENMDFYANIIKVKHTERLLVF